MRRRQYSFGSTPVRRRPRDIEIPGGSAVFRDTGPDLDSNARNAFFGRFRRISTPSPFHRAIKSCGVDPSVSYI